MIYVESLGLHQHPMNSGDLNAVARRVVTNLSPPLRRNVCHRVRQCKWRQLDTGVADAGYEGEYVIQSPITENLVADCKTHRLTVGTFVLGLQARNWDPANATGPERELRLALDVLTVSCGQVSARLKPNELGAPASESKIRFLAVRLNSKWGVTQAGAGSRPVDSK